MRYLHSILFMFLITIVLYGCGYDFNNTGKKISEIVHPTVDDLYFHRIDEPNEKAFSFLAPGGWELSGGIIRVNNLNQWDSYTEAKLYMKLSSPDSKSVFCWLPDNRYYDTNYNNHSRMENINSGLTPMSFLSPGNYIVKIAFPFAHPHARSTTLVEVETINDIASLYNEPVDQIQHEINSSHSGAIVTMRYCENDTLFIEKFFCVIEDRRKSNSREWGNKETWYFRTALKDYETMEPVFATIGESVWLNPQWVKSEIKNNNVLVGEVNDQYITSALQKFCEQKTRLNNIVFYHIKNQLIHYE